MRVYSLTLYSIHSWLTMLIISKVCGTYLLTQVTRLVVVVNTCTGYDDYEVHWRKYTQVSLMISRETEIAGESVVELANTEYNNCRVVIKHTWAMN